MFQFKLYTHTHTNTHTHVRPFDSIMHYNILQRGVTQYIPSTERVYNSIIGYNTIFAKHLRRAANYNALQAILVSFSNEITTG